VRFVEVEAIGVARVETVLISGAPVETTAHWVRFVKVVLRSKDGVPWCQSR
jgi:hypothetical protein